MKNKKIVFFCQECGYESAKWMGQCPGCKAWNTFVEEPVSTVRKSTGITAGRLAGRAEQPPPKHGLYRVNDGHLRLQPFHHLTDGIQIRLTQKLHFVIKGTDPIGPQTMFSEEVGSAPGSVSQVRESTNVLMQIAKGLGITIFIVGHVTKEGNVAGPRVLEHMVDTVLYFVT